MAKKPTTEQVNDFSDTLKNLVGSGDIKTGDISKGVSAYRTGMMSKQKIIDKLLGAPMSMTDAEYKMGTDLTGSKSIRGKAKAEGKNLPKKLKVGKKDSGKLYGAKLLKKKGMMGGGKMYTSMNKRYANGGKIYPSKGKS